MSTAVMAQCWPLKMPPTPKSVLISLADNANDQGHCWPSIATICERTCFSKRAVIDAISWLEINGALSADRTNGRHTTYVVTPAKYVEPVHQAHQCGNSTGASTASEPVQQPHQPVHLPHQPVQQPHTNRKEPSLTVNKSNRHKGASGNHVELPDWLQADLWADWVAYRKAARKPMTQRAEELAIAKLGEICAEGWTAKAVIENAIVSGWQGLYAPKTQAVRSTSGNRQQQLESSNRRASNDWLEDSPQSRRRL